jgi:hypothetical protein
MPEWKGLAMPEVRTDQCPYGKLQLVIDDDVQWFALAPDATLTDIVDMFHATAGAVPRRLLSVRISIQSAP